MVGALACWLMTAAPMPAAPGDGLRLDRTSAVYEVPTQKGLDLREEVTIEAWVRADAMGPEGGRILDKSAPGTQQGYMLDTYPGNSLRFLNAKGMCRFDARLAADRWTHVAGVYSAPRKIMRLYVDGKQVAQLSEGDWPVMTVSSVPLRVGCDPEGGNRFLGQIKRAAIYRRALTAEEIAARYEAAEPAALEGVLGDWKFEAKPGRRITPVAGALALQRAGGGGSSPGFAGEFVGEAPPPASPLTLWYRRPASQWVEALPIGNGRMGAMVFGGVDQERLQFNEDTLWTGQPHEYHHEGAAKFLPVIRQLLADGKPTVWGSEAGVPGAKQRDRLPAGAGFGFGFGEGDVSSLERDGRPAGEGTT